MCWIFEYGTRNQKYHIIIWFRFSIQLGQTFTKPIDPFTSNPVDETVIETLVSITKTGVALLWKYNDSGNAAIDYLNITDSLGKLARVFNKSYPCVMTQYIGERRRVQQNGAGEHRK